MLPFDNKSGFQVVVDMPAGTPLEDTSAATLHERWARFWRNSPKCANLQGYAGTASPITFNGLVRQYYLRADAEQGDLQVNLVDKHHRSRQKATPLPSACALSWKKLRPKPWREVSRWWKCRPARR